ncbi:EAL domain-containing protein [Immundisolibacter sp.]|uniref:bifunctional diguanylate cyclase/phosphodiesterase n=1 Tax=Immundisolibacter sp. TaxID=1934948 RepID=UPI00261F20BE|nr:EAL domain-containing protein [Immundisolibacter sp.]
MSAAAVVALALPMLALLGWSAEHLRAAAREDTALHARAMADDVARRHNQVVADARTVLAVLAQVPRLVEDVPGCTVLMRRLVAAGGPFVNLGVIGVDGRVLCSALPVPPGLNLGDRRYFRRAVETRRFAAGTYQVGRITGAPGINFGLPLLGDDGAVRAVVFAAIGTGWMSELFDSALLPAGATLVLLDHQLGELARYPPRAPDDLALPVPASALASLIRQQPQAGVVPVPNGGGSARHYMYLRLGGEALSDPPYLVLGWPPDALASTLDTAVRRQPLVVWAALLVLAGLAWLVVNMAVVEPVRRLAVAAARLADGEQGVRLPASGWVAELVAMRSAFNHMAQRVDGALRAYAVLSAGNRALLHESDEQHLLQAMCEVAVGVGGYRCAWVSYLDDGGIQTMARAGDDGGFAAYLQAHWQTALAHRTPTAEAIASGQPVMLGNAHRPAVHDLFATAAGRGLKSGLVLPLKVDGRVIGVFTIHAAEVEAFHQRERTLLAEMADDLSFGIAAARLRVRQQQAEARLQHLAYFDPVTGVPNQASFLECTGGLLADAGQLAVLVVQLENYWEIAATLGQSSAEVYLKELAQRLDALAPTLLARVTQAEFALLLAGADAAAANREAGRVLATLSAPVQLAGIGIDVRASVGIALGGDHRHGDAERVLQAAQLAANEAAGRASPVALAPPNVDRQWRERLALLSDLRVAIDQRQLAVYVQPQLDLRSGRICGMEALARWRHPRHGDVPPARFIDLAEKTGLIRPLTHAVLDEVCGLALGCAAAGLMLPIAVNVSARNLHDPEFVGRVAGLLQRWPLPRACLHLELTETAVMQEPALSLRVLQTLHGLGLSIYLDDFGTGQSSMAYLRELPLSGLKIDRAFVAGLDQPATRRIVQAMIDLGHALNQKVVAEGVEDDATAATLAGMGCDIAQGYGIARPMPGSEIIAWIGRRSGEGAVGGTDRGR